MNITTPRAARANGTSRSILRLLPVLPLAPLFLIIALFVFSCTAANEEVQDVPTADSVNSVTDSVAKKEPAKLNEDGIDTTAFHVSDTTIMLKNQDFPVVAGKVINVMVTGIDSRLGDPMGHADANHLMRFWLDSGCVEIISIPRDTYFDAGFEDSTGLNKLTNVRANRGRSAYLKAVCEIVGVPKIDYYVEFGFSQAIGLLELLGYKANASGTLRVLRSRQAYSAGDFQRVYNQGQFIRQALLRNFERTDGFLGEVAIRAALLLVETNMSYSDADNILTSLRSRGFGTDNSKVWVRLKPAVISKMKVYDFDEENVNEINKQISHKIHRLGLDSIKITEETYEKKLAKLLDRASADSAKSPSSVVRLLKRPYDQRAWLQITDRDRRAQYRSRLCGLLSNAYTRVKNPTAAQKILDYMKIEEQASAGE